MVIFLYGEDSFRRKKKYVEISSEFVKKNGNLGLSEFDEENINDFIEGIKSRSMFASVTFVGIRDIDLGSLPADKLSLLRSALMGSMDDKNVVVLISSPSLPSSADMEFLSAAPVISQEFSPLSREKLSFYITKEASRKGLNISDADAKNLMISFEGDLWAISSELDKLSSAKDRSVPSASFTGPSYFELLNALKSGKTVEKRLIALEIILNKLKEDPARVFNGLAYSAPRDMLKEKWFELMADYDIAIKSGKMDYEEALVDFVIR
jgi:DNA polymerase III delta subunit